MSNDSGKTHMKLGYLKQWIEVDVGNTIGREKMLSMIESDDEKDSPVIIDGINNSKYSPYKKYLSNMGNTQLNCMKADKILSTTMMTVLAAAKLKRLIKNPKSKA